MVHVQFNPELLSTLQDKVVVLTGGATGIGRSAVEQFADAGCKVVFGDIDEAPARKSESLLGSSVHFLHCDTSSYSDQLALFAAAESKYGGVDIVVANAGMAVHKDIFAPSSDIGAEPSMKEIDVNLCGAIFTARIGMHYLRKRKEGGDLVLVSSIAGFKECGGIATYTASKHGVLGLMRGLHITAIEERIRINVICPWMTKTRLVKGIEDGWRALGLPENEAEDVARSIVLCGTANRSNEGKIHGGARMPFAGKILWIAGGQAYEIEDAIQALEPQWLGEENSKILSRGQEYLASKGTSWDADELKTHKMV
ncbi:putative 15-hydroxyprostaglandin dehydrogenase [Aaosphaeria arxii CBS 175.79]|uniref:Putative 15-hydroxyprostaglandin dehydrogenase n=1 Tax=Aaosphaeria arxii CBS 175.79 TaxID=1450172 RepID=A0A6A5XA43_9PLEO|nr:putative 15-hydroxyprostaglandin dehydrogenase [Aaosphaeria arxii CBS 175.79]KAF2009811.1 putative 15-hydroxyprostaglandin dehydrogenase [Aaosphaeria arxii CBS 175.79]